MCSKNLELALLQNTAHKLAFDTRTLSQKVNEFDVGTFNSCKKYFRHDLALLGRVLRDNC